jgi:hypothetical protein
MRQREIMVECVHRNGVVHGYQLKLTRDITAEWKKWYCPNSNMVFLL